MMIMKLLYLPDYTFRWLGAIAFMLSAAATFAPRNVSAQAPTGPLKVRLVKVAGNWQLQRDGKPFYVKGAGGDGSREELAAAGANSTRSWGVDKNTRSELDQAHKHGLTMAVGIWLGHERHGFDYSNQESTSAQLRTTLAHIQSLKDHPAVLVWGIGNEMEGSGDNPEIWKHVQRLAVEAKKIDPNHPVMTVIAGIGGQKVQNLHKFCPDIDIVGINAYGEAPEVPERYRALGGTKPYIVTEFGPTGTWECPKNSLGAVIELTSGQKADEYKKSSQAFERDQQLCLGSYAFLWGNKQEGTATWFGMLLPDGRRTAAVDTMTEIWSGKPPANRCPVIEQIELTGPLKVNSGDRVQVRLLASDPDGDKLKVRWVVTGEADSYSTGGDAQYAPPEIKEAIVKSDLSGATITAPEVSGIYRVYAYVDDGEPRGVATANVSIGVTGSAVRLGNQGKKVQLPLVVLDEPGTHPYTPSGFMGSATAVKVDDACATAAKSGAHCTRVTYDREGDWAGVVWQNPANDWGSKAGGFDLTGATALTFWARGGSGGEQVKFGMGLIGKDQPFHDTVKKEQMFTLTDQWKLYSINLEGADLRRIKSGFFFAVAGQGKPVEFFLDQVQYK